MLKKQSKALLRIPSPASHGAQIFPDANEIERPASVLAPFVLSMGRSCCRGARYVVVQPLCRRSALRVVVRLFVLLMSPVCRRLAVRIVDG